MRFGGTHTTNRVPQCILLDNSALNYIVGQEQRGFKITDSDRQVLIDAVRASVVAAEFEMSRNRKFYGLPADMSRWPRPRDFVSLWHARGYVAARLRELFGEGRRCNDGGDLYDNMLASDVRAVAGLSAGKSGWAPHQAECRKPAGASSALPCSPRLPSGCPDPAPSLGTRRNGPERNGNGFPSHLRGLSAKIASRLVYLGAPLPISNPARCRGIRPYSAMSFTSTLPRVALE
jgi:hypothetical protein